MDFYRDSLGALELYWFKQWNANSFCLVVRLDPLLISPQGGSLGLCLHLRHRASSRNRGSPSSHLQHPLIGFGPPTDFRISSLMLPIEELTARWGPDSADPRLGRLLFLQTWAAALIGNSHLVFPILSPADSITSRGTTRKSYFLHGYPPLLLNHIDQMAFCCHLQASD